MRLPIAILYFFIPVVSWCQNTLAKEWDMSYGGKANDEATCFIRTCDGGYLIGGYSNSLADGVKEDSPIGGYDYWVVRTDSDGIKLWDHTYGGASDDVLAQILLTNDCGFLLIGTIVGSATGDITQPPRGGYDFWVLKIDSNGAKEWDGRYGGTGSDILMTGTMVPDGGCLIGGYSNSPASGDKSEHNRGMAGFSDDYWVLKLDASGTKVWDKTYGGSDQDGLSSIVACPDGGYLMGGYSASEVSGDKTDSLRGGGSADYWGRQG